MELFDIAGLFGLMLVLAAIPSASVGLVVARSATSGFQDGAAAAAGVVAGDLVFMLLAIFGMSALAGAMGSAFLVIRLAGGAFLIWMGIRLLRSKPSMAESQAAGVSRSAGLVVSFLAGLLLTLGDVKAIVFYASLFPAFLDLSALSHRETATIALMTAGTVGGVKLAYAAFARALAARLQGRRIQRLGRLAAGSLMVGTGTCLIARD